MTDRAFALALTERRGPWVAAAVLVCWLGSLALGIVLLSSSIAWAPLVIALRTLASTALFITAHDAMHGLVAPQHRRANDAVGALCLTLYAFLPYGRMRSAHHEHHRIPARDGDPDFRAAGFARWFLGFFAGYVSAPIVLANAALFIALALAGAPVFTLIVVWVAPALLSALQLFLFGTYLPHRPGAGHDDDHRARSTQAPPLVSFFQCFHFGYHWEHHDAPWTPWWLLPSRRALR